MEIIKGDENSKNILILVIIVVACTSIIMLRGGKVKKDNTEVNKVDSYNINVIKKTYEENKQTNYLVSPYNIEVALNMLREGALGNTKDEIDKVVGNRTINDISILNKLNIANGIFIRDEYKNGVKNDFINVLNNKYHSEVLYDKFETPDIINNWVSNKTNGMISKILDKMNKDFVMGLASALALDVEWLDSFECVNTLEETFTKVDNSKINVEMMHQTYRSNAKYINNDEVEGIVLPYNTNDKNELEFIAIIPKDGVDNYIKNLTQDKLDNITKDEKETSNKLHVNLSLPRFSYNYSVENFIKVLKKMGINDAFDKDLANFKNMIEIRENVYVGEAIHKTRIELNEKGTKAAAVTYFGMFKATGMLEKDFEEVNIKFNKPFVYMIREKNTGEILFFGSVFEPNKWEKTTCENN